MAERHGIYFDENGRLVVNPHPGFLEGAGADAHQTVMTAVDPHEATRREDVRRKAKAIVERETNRDHEITPMEAIIEDNEARGNSRLARLLKAIQLAEAAAGGLKAKPIAAPAIAPGGQPLYYAAHGSDTGHALETATRSGELQNPSFAVHSTVGPGPIRPPSGPFGGSGVTYVVPRRAVTPGNGRVVYVDRDFGSSDRYSFLETVRSYYKDQTGKELAESEFWKPSRHREPILNDVIDAAYQAMHEHDVEVGRDRGAYARTPAEAAALRAALDRQIEAGERQGLLLFDYNEAKINESVPLSGMSVLIDAKRSFPNYDRAVKLGIPVERPTYPAEVAEAMRSAGARVIEYDGTDPRGFPDALNEANAFFTNDAQQDAKGGDTRVDAEGGDSPGSETAVSETAVSEPAPQAQGGPRIVVNPSTFRNKKDALCVAFNEAFRILMEDMSFSPVSEPTDKQRAFFSDTAYANDEEQLRRTILARICTFDTSVKDPTDEQLQEAVEFLEGVMEAGYPQNEWEQSSVQRIHDVVERAIGAPPAEEPPAEEPPAEEPLAEARADIGGGDSGTKEEETLAEPGAQQGAGPADGDQGPDDEEDPHDTAGGQEMEEGKVYVDYAKSAVSGGGGLTDNEGGLLGEFRRKGQNDEPDTGVAPLDPGELRRTFRATAKRKSSL